MSYQTVLNKIPVDKEYERSKYSSRDEEAFFKALKSSKSKSKSTKTTRSWKWQKLNVAGPIMMRISIPGKL